MSPTPALGSWDAFSSWYGTADPTATALALGRVALVGLLAYLVFVLALTTALRLRPRRWLLAIAEMATAGPTRQLVARTARTGLASGLLVALPVAAQTPNQSSPDPSTSAPAPRNTSTTRSATIPVNPAPAVDPPGTATVRLLPARSPAAPRPSSPPPPDPTGSTHAPPATPTATSALPIPTVPTAPPGDPDPTDLTDATNLADPLPADDPEPQANNPGQHTSPATPPVAAPGGAGAVPTTASVPAAEPSTASPATEHGSEIWVIARGDHLWAVAEETLADRWGRTPTEREITTYWRAVVATNRHRLADPDHPDLVFAGQVVELPPA